MSFARAKLIVEWAPYSDYLRAQPAYYEMDTVDTAYWRIADVVTVPTASTLTIDLSYFTTIYGFGIQNQDPNNYVTLIYKSAGGGATSQTTRVLPIASINPTTPAVLTPPATGGAFFWTSDVTQSTNPTLQANTNPCVCSITIIGK